MRSICVAVHSVSGACGCGIYRVGHKKRGILLLSTFLPIID